MADAQLPQEKFAEDLDELEEAITNLQVLYEKYFLGIDRRPPEQERLRVSRKMREMRTTMVRNTALKFRINTMFAKLLSFERMWDRTAKLHLKDRDHKKEGRPAAAAPAEIPEPQLRKLYDTYLLARQRCGEPTDGISFESVANRIRAQVPQLKEKHKARNIEFKVVIKGGKAVLKAIPHE